MAERLHPLGLVEWLGTRALFEVELGMAPDWRGLAASHSPETCNNGLEWALFGQTHNKLNVELNVDDYVSYF